MSDMNLLEKIDPGALAAIPVLTPEQDLQRRLGLLGISVFSSESVDAYKRHKLNVANRGQWWREPILRFVALSNGNVIPLTGIVLVGSSSASKACGIVVLRRRRSRTRRTMFCTGLGMLCFAASGVSLKTRAVWHRVEPNHTRASMPSAVASIAEKAAAQRNMTVRVDELRQYRSLIDPFLVVIDLGTGAEAYVAVWDEADFRV